MAYSSGATYVSEQKVGGKIGRKDGKKEEMIEKGREVHKMK